MITLITSRAKTVILSSFDLKINVGTIVASISRLLSIMVGALPYTEWRRVYLFEALSKRAL